MASPFDDIPVTAAPSAPPTARGGGAFDDIPVTHAPTWGQRVRSAFTGEGRTEFPQAEEFHVALRRAGLTPEQAQAQPRGRDPQTFWEHVRRALGSAEFDAPPAPEGGPVQFDATAINRAAITPDPKAQVDILRRNIPGLESREDRHGNVMLRAPTIGVNQWTYLNAPGMSGRDWEEAGTQFLATLPFGAAVGLGRTLAGRAAIGGASLGTASVAQDVAATAMGSEQGIDPTRAAISAGIGTVAGPVAGWLAGRAANAPTPLAAQRAAEMVDDRAAYGRLGVRPFGPAFNQGPVASVAKQITETPVIGGPARRALEESISGTARVADDIAGRFGLSATADDAGRVVREGLERFREAAPEQVVGPALTPQMITTMEQHLGRQMTAAERAQLQQAATQAQRDAIIAAPVRDTSLRTKQGALYDRAWSMIPEDMQQGRSVRGLPRVTGGMANTRDLLDDIAKRNTRMTNSKGGAVEAGTGRTLPGGFLGDVIGAMRNKSWTAALQTMRDIRSDFRRLQSGISQAEGSVLRHSDIDRIESAITKDMIALLERNAGEYARLGQQRVAADMQRAIGDFRRADTFTRLSMERWQRIERLFKAENETALFRNVAQAALTGVKGDVSKLRVLARTLRRDEMDEIASYTLREMGRPVGSARGYTQEIGFSPGSFMTRFNNMSAEARNIIFGRAHTQALEDLSRVVNRIANVEALANTSRSASNAINTSVLLGGGGALAGAPFGASWEAAILGMATGYGASLLFSRPLYVTWLSGYLQLRGAAAQAGSRMGPALTAHIGRLQAMAASDPALIPVLRRLTAVEPEQEGPGGQPNVTK
jgi:hypothetical protein